MRKLDNLSFNICSWVESDLSGRAACPACLQTGKIRQKNLSIDLSTGAYKCWRGCTPDQIRAALSAPQCYEGCSTGVSSLGHRIASASRIQPRTVSAEEVLVSHQRLINQSGEPQQQALDWLFARGFTREMIGYHRFGLEPKWITSDDSNLNTRQCYWAVALHIPADEPGQFYRKLRVAPWLTGEERPEYLAKWLQYGVPATIFYTHRPENAEATWFCEGEWDALCLGWLAKQREAQIAVCCSTAGCGTVPPKEQLDQLPKSVILFFDRNDEPTPNGMIPGDEGARKLAFALEGRGRIAQVPMPEACQVKGWDVCNAVEAGFVWEDFEAAANIATSLTAAELEGHKATNRSIRDQVLAVLHRYESQSERDVALIDLSRATNYSYRELEKLAQSLAIEVEMQTRQVEADRKLKDLIQTRRMQLDLHRYLEPWFAQVMIETANAMPTAPEFLFTTLLSAAASRMGTGAQVVIKPSAKYTQPMVFWSAIVAHSGSMKTPAQRVILDPLIALEKDAYESYQTELADYRAALESQKGKKREAQDNTPQPPIRKRYLTKDSTLETLQRLHAENPRGLLYYRDELAGAVKVRNQYRGGYGADEEAELDQWVGSAVIVDRAEKSICLPRSAISRTGAIQWEVLADLMGDHQDVNGAWSRWLFCAAESPPRYLRLVQEDQDTGITEALTDLYTALEQVPQQDYLLSFEAKQLFETWQHQLVDAQRAEEALGLQLVYPKMEAYTARLALWLHLVNAMLRHEPPATAINSDTMTKAIELAAYYLWQHRLIHAHNSPDSGLTAISLKIQKFAERIGEVTASRLKSSVRSLRKVATDQIRQLMGTLANAGYGFVQGEGTGMIYIPNPGIQPPQSGFSPSLKSEIIDSIDTTEMTMSMAEIQIRQEQQKPIDAIDVAKQLNSETIQESAEQLLNSASDLAAHATLNSIGTALTIAEIKATTIASEVSTPANSQQSDPTTNSLSAEKPPNQQCNSNGQAPIVVSSRGAGNEPKEIQVGGICHYVGSALKPLKGLDRLLVEAIEGDMAIVKASGWYISHRVLITELTPRITPLND